jgi:WD40 repeat protein
VLIFLSRYETQDGIYDVAWSEIHENQLVTGSGDGTLKLWDILLNVCLYQLISISESIKLVFVPRTFQYALGMSTVVEFSPSIGRISRKTRSRPPHGMEMSSW